VEAVELPGQGHGFFSLRPWSGPVDELIRAVKRFMDKASRPAHAELSSYCSCTELPLCVFAFHCKLHKNKGRLNFKSPLLDIYYVFTTLTFDQCIYANE
jgi:hypothetical protein